MKLSLTWSAANDEDGFTRTATVVHCSHGPRQANLVLKVPSPSRNRLPGLTP
jgi:hypothetical protein